MAEITIIPVILDLKCVHSSKRNDLKAQRNVIAKLLKATEETMPHHSLPFRKPVQLKISQIRRIMAIC